MTMLVYKITLSKGEAIYVTKAKLEAIAQSPTSFFEVEEYDGTTIFMSKSHIVSAVPNQERTNELQRLKNKDLLKLESEQAKPMTDEQVANINKIKKEIAEKYGKHTK